MSFPKVLCVRDLSILGDRTYQLRRFFNVMPFCIKSEDNVSHLIESRTPLLPFETVTANENISYNADTVILLERITQFDTDHYELVPLDSGTGYLHLIKNLRSPEQLSLFRSVGAQFARNVRFIRLKYFDGYQYLRGFEGIVNV